MTETNGAIPATRAAIERTTTFAVGGPERLYTEQLQNGVARPRPQTSAYRAITRAFVRAYTEIMRGAAVRPALDETVRAIDKDLTDHQYYPPTGR